MEYCSFYCEKYIKKEKKLKENKEIIYSMDSGLCIESRRLDSTSMLRLLMRANKVTK